MIKIKSLSECKEFMPDLYGIWENIFIERIEGQSFIQYESTPWSYQLDINGCWFFVPKDFCEVVNERH